jgi:hypothetical protein
VSLIWKKHTLSLSVRFNFFLWIGRLGYQKNRLSYWFQNVHLTTFLLRSNIQYIFEISMKRRFFETPFSIVEEKMFHLLEGTINTFWELEGQKWKKPLKMCESGFLKPAFDFWYSYKILCQTSKLRNFVKMTGLCTRKLWLFL